MLYGFSRKTLIFKTWVMPDTLKVSAILGKFRRVAFKHALREDEENNLPALRSHFLFNQGAEM